MSSGPFTTAALYEMDNGDITTLDVQPETLLAEVGGTVNVQASGTIRVGIPSAKFSKTDGEIGLRPRCATGKWATVPPTGQYSVGGRVCIPILSAANASVFVRGATMNYLGGTVTLGRPRPENVV